MDQGKDTAPGGMRCLPRQTSVFREPFKLAARLCYAPPITQLGSKALAFKLDQSIGALQPHPHVLEVPRRFALHPLHLDIPAGAFEDDTGNTAPKLGPFFFAPSCSTDQPAPTLDAASFRCNLFQMRPNGNSPSQTCACRSR